MSGESASPAFSSDWAFYGFGLALILLGIIFFLIPFIARSSGISGLKIHPLILYVYNKGGFYFATSPILLIVSAVAIVIFLIHR